MQSFIHSGSLGDVIYSLPTIRSLSSDAFLYLRPDVPDTIPAWAGKRQPYRMTRDQAEKLLPLLNDQPGLRAAIWSGESINYDLDLFRSTGFDLGRGDIAAYYRYAFPQASPVLDLPWLKVRPSTAFANKILVNRTLRYRAPVSYRFLASRRDVVFVGLPDEYRDFASDCPGVPHAQAHDFKQLAEWIAGCRGFVGNQSFCFSVAQALMMPRILECFVQAPNVIIHGSNGADCIDQRGLEVLVQKL